MEQHMTIRAEFLKIIKQLNCKSQKALKPETQTIQQKTLIIPFYLQESVSNELQNYKKTYWKSTTEHIRIICGNNRKKR